MNRTLVLLICICIGAPVLAFIAAGVASGANVVPALLTYAVFGIFLVGALFEIKRLADQP